MTTVNPNASSASPELSGIGEDALTVLTVWRKSLLLNCSGFTVFNCSGNLVFRVDNYGSGSKDELLLMDAAGNPVLTIRRKKLSLGESCLIYEGEGGAAGKPPLFAVKKHVNLLHAKSLAHVAPCSGGNGGGVDDERGYEIEGSYLQRSCTVYDGRRRQAVAEVRRKESKCGVAFGGDVFRLVVRPGIDAPLAMAIVIALDQMHG